eukprot:4541934-Prymnesium_polylepis.2
MDGGGSLLGLVGGGNTSKGSPESARPKLSGNHARNRRNKKHKCSQPPFQTGSTGVLVSTVYRCHSALTASYFKGN